MQDNHEILKQLKSTQAICQDVGALAVMAREIEALEKIISEHPSCNDQN